MTSPAGIESHESPVTVALIVGHQVIKTRWLYCPTARLQDATFVRYILRDSMRTCGFSQLPGLQAMLIEGLLCELEAAPIVKGALQ